MPITFVPNRFFEVSIRHIGHERHPILIVDDFLLNPELLVEYAARQAQFRSPSSLYPGLIASPPVEYVQVVGQSLGRLIASAFGVNVQTAQVRDTFLGIVTTPPGHLQTPQRLPHVDNTDIGQIAILHYLCDDSHGGTGFYRHRQTGFESLSPATLPRMTDILNQELWAGQEHLDGYADDEHALFKQTARVPARFNRLIAYRSHIFHSGQIGTAPLNPEPHKGRLTANIFVGFQPEGAGGMPHIRQPAIGAA